MDTLLDCHCGGNEFRATTLLPVAVHVSNDALTLEVDGIYDDDVTNLDLACLSCGMTLGHDGLARHPVSGAALSDQYPAWPLLWARAAAMFALRDANFMTPLDHH